LALLTLLALSLGTAPNALNATPANRSLIEASLSSVVVADPINGAVNPKAIPGGIVEYRIGVSNGSPSVPSATNIVIGQPVPSNMALFVGDIDGPGDGPVAFADGSHSSGLNYLYLGLDQLTDSLEFSNDGGVTYDHTPMPNAQGIDPPVTHFRVRLLGAMSPGGQTASSFSLRCRTVIK
jgi:uncharacterized repeat protein (TIGR01451 family)